MHLAIIEKESLSEKGHLNFFLNYGLLLESLEDQEIQTAQCSLYPPLLRKSTLHSQ